MSKSRCEIQLENDTKEYWKFEAEKRQMTITEFIKTSVFFYLKESQNEDIKLNTDVFRNLEIILHRNGVGNA